MKRCSKCGEEKPAEAFSFKVKGKPTRRAACAVCSRKAKEHWTAENRRKQYESSRRWHRKKKYGLDDDAFNDLLASQDARCAICSDDISAKPYVDHCHRTGVVRALLCCNCNVAIGMLADDPDRARAAADYLEQHG